MLHPLRTFAYRCLRVYWRWLKPVVLGSRALVLRDEQVLLVRLTYTTGWHLPGGGVAKTESFLAAIRRELREECALDAVSPQLFGLYHSTKTGKTDQVAIYVVREFKQIAHASADPEIAEMRFFPLRELPADTTPATRKRVEDYLSGGPRDDQW